MTNKEFKEKLQQFVDIEALRMTSDFRDSLIVSIRKFIPLLDPNKKVRNIKVKTEGPFKVEYEIEEGK